MIIFEWAIPLSHQNEWTVRDYKYFSANVLHQNWTLIYSSHTYSRSSCDWFTACAHAGGCGLFCRYGVIYGCRGRWSWRRPSRQLKSASYTWRKACLKWTFKQMFSKHQGGKNGNSSKVQRAFVLFFALTPAIFINEFQQVFPLMVLVRAWLSCNVSVHCLFVGFHWCASECRRSLSIFTPHRQSLILQLSFHQAITLAMK